MNFNSYKIESILQSTKCNYLFFIKRVSLYLWSFLAFEFRTEGKNDFVSFQKLYATFSPITSTMTTFVFSPDGRCIIWEFDVSDTKAATVRRSYHRVDHIQNENTIYLV